MKLRARETFDVCLRSAGSSERVSIRSPLNGCGKASCEACRNWRLSEASGTVDGVADDRQVDRRQMDANLVHPARLEPYAQQRVAGPEPVDLEVRHGVSRCGGVEGHPGGLAPVAADRGLDAAGAGPRTALDEREVGALERAPAHEGRKPPVRLFAAGDDHQPRGVPVEPVHDAAALRLAAARLGTERVDKGAGRVPGSGMDDEARGLVDHEQVLVLPHDRRLGGRRRGRWHLVANENCLAPVSRKLFGRACPSTSAPAATARSAAAREPRCPARKRSSRSPTASTGTSSSIWRTTGPRRRAGAAGAGARGRRRRRRRAGSRRRPR